MKNKKYFCDWYKKNKKLLNLMIIVFAILSNSAWLFTYFWGSDIEFFVGMAVVAAGVVLTEFIGINNCLDKIYQRSEQKKEENNCFL